FQWRHGRWRSGAASHKGGDRANAGQRLDEDFLSLAVKFGSKKGHAHDIPTRLAERAHKALAKHIVSNSQSWNAGRCPLRGTNCCISRRDDHIHGTAHQIGRMNVHSLRRQAETSGIDHEVSAFNEAEPSHFIEHRHIMRCIARARKQAAETINAPDVLSTRCQRPRSRAAEQRYERAAFHSITSSARASSVGGTSRPRALAVLRLTMSSSLVDNSTGNSLG